MEIYAFSFIVLWTKKQYSSFLRKILAFQKFFFKINVLNAFKVPVIIVWGMPVSWMGGCFGDPWYHFFGGRGVFLLPLG